MTREFIILFFRAAGTTFMPWLIPLLYAAIAGLSMHFDNPLYFSLLLGAGAVSGTMLLWMLDGYIDPWLKKYIKTTNSQKTWLGKVSTKLHDKLHIVQAKPLLFVLIAVTIWSVVPDILIIRIVRKKVSIWFFLLATIIGKAFVYTPVIYGVELVEVLIGRFM